MTTNLAILIIHRNDRPQFLEHLKKMISWQTFQPALIHYVDYPPESDEKDITQRYRRGYGFLRDRKDIDVIALMEVDDYYHPTYLETMVNKWVESGQPDLLGANYTIYYHLMLRKYFVMQHPKRASAMNTLIKPGLIFPWCADNYPYTDLHLWRLCNPLDIGTKPLLTGALFKPEKIISIGMKHGLGLCGGISHKDRFDRYKFDDFGLNFIIENCDKESTEFYSGFKK